MSGAVSKRYARALFEVASERGKLDQIEADLKAVVEAIEQNADLSKILLHPHIARAAKKSLADDLFKRHVSEETHNFLNVLIDNGREGQLLEVYRSFVRMANEARGIAEATVTSAKPLSDEEQAELAEKLGQKLNKKLRVQTVVDPSILGGIVIKIGDRLYDGSIKTKLEHFAHQQ
ncbi:MULTISPECIES: F0F1 ATP synthase subunit delta [Bacillales]|jgi:F-type H+-transporting ATPase subunit delta|uniref:ATP synthase subunit delta n=1 Tax=Brevibacillus aydinogluensis TaxID=927786 RepID=A0AA48RGB0_9BACL|nr:MULTISPECIES: F0F1 ATP synthase subunit delta [Bacillales]REK67973.1 MAG: F0F1 ATP synthase subunit delta [Brevibacillus sp.]MBR8659735.1 F0F1 ATP synthase subunit delta [Brevibacillus sp. NL20B1]MDT3416664.1 F-type H+-transporting ATPase subunit delta [Brevibacillus aydinogluensis]NNV01281.1 F0F1 ATP synthase subunit delta [Brevibacillus sp. MCWH]UFJ62017.1 F0F1 ATP synthase subunit delta [Anoxybacillus sediminis]